MVGIYIRFPVVRRVCKEHHIARNLQVTYLADSCILLFSCTDTPPTYVRSFKLTQLLTYKNFKCKKEKGSGNGFEMLAMGRLWRKNTVGV